MVLQMSEAPVAQTCDHHWIIQRAHGTVSPGVCQSCFQTREFKNSMEDWYFYKDTIRFRN